MFRYYDKQDKTALLRREAIFKERLQNHEFIFKLRTPQCSIYHVRDVRDPIIF
jgi:hypothetical protein